MRTGFAVAAAAVFSALAGAQPPTFEVASVKPDKAGSAGGEGSTRDSISTTPLNVTLHNVTLRRAIEWAYAVREFQLQGPAWFGTERYDIAARAGMPVSSEQIRLMLRDVLASRFQLRLRRTTRDLPVFDMLTMPAGPKMVTADGRDEPRMFPADGELVFQNFSMATLAERLGAMPFRLERPVIDKTGLEGVFNFRLKLAASATEMKHNFEAGDGGPSIPDAIRQQLGLRLEPRRGAVEMLIVESADKVPSEN